MTTTVSVDLPQAPYDIHIASGLLQQAGQLINSARAEQAGKVLVIADETVFAVHGATLTSSLDAAGLNYGVTTFKPGEGSKNIATCEALWQACAQEQIDRAGAIVALGGGVSGDMAGFVSATWMRGIDFIQIPTSLLAMVDSSVGGKTGVNSAAGKNLIGSFQQPNLVIIDPDVLQTMEAREYAAGLAEVVKYGIIYDPEFLNWQEQNINALNNRDTNAIIHAVAESCRIKAHFVVNDEKEHGIRAHLNYGHTFGHALEKETGYTKLLHGEAVSIGMAMAAQAAESLGVLQDTALAQRQNALLEALHLPTVLTVDDQAAWSERLEIATAGDKKVRAGKRRFVLPEQAGTIQQITNPDRHIIRQAFAQHLSAT